MTWELNTTRSAQKALARLPGRDRTRIKHALVEMEEDPFLGDVTRLQNFSIGYRRRIGNYRILFDVDFDNALVHVREIGRRSSQTYRR